MKINGVTVPDRSVEVWLAAINWVIDSGDAFMLFRDRFTRDEIAQAREDATELRDRLGHPA